MLYRGFPGGAVVGSPPADAGDMGSSPGLGRSHMPWSNGARAPQLLSLRSGAHEPQLLSLSATTTEARTPRARALQRERPPNEKSAHCSEGWPLLATTREKPAHSNEDPRQPKIKINKIN